MDLVPKRHSLLAEATSVLRDAIRSGRWSKLLPGERKLCQQMQIGRDTLRAALRQLEKEGLLAPGEAGRQRKIIGVRFDQPGGEKSVSAGTIAFLTPNRLERISDRLLLEVDVLRERLAGSGYRLEIVSSSKVFQQARPASALVKLTEECAAEVWILHHTTAPMQRWFAEKGPPCLLHGQPQGVEIPAVDIDYAAVGRHAGGFLLRRGHRDVAILRPHASLKGLDMAEAGLREAFAAHSGGDLVEPMSVREAETGDARSLAASLSRLMRSKRRPTALVLTRTRQALTVLSWLATQGLRVPDDLSIIALDYSPTFEHLLPEIACYKSDAEGTAGLVFRKVLEIAASGGAVKSPQALMPDFVAGASVAKLK